MQREIAMRKLSSFTFITLNSCYRGPNEDISWHNHGPEESEYAVESLKAGNILLFGRVTYEMMAGFWPSADAMKNAPVMAAGMNSAEKIVFSKTLTKASWNNTRVVRGDLVAEIKKLKGTPGKDMTILGSGSIVTQFAEAGLVDEFQVMVDPVVIPGGTPLFNGIGKTLRLELVATRVFKSGVVLMRYRPGVT
jgi:dihydrofolate reductase